MRRRLLTAAAIGIVATLGLPPAGALAVADEPQSSTQSSPAQSNPQAGSEAGPEAGHEAGSETHHVTDLESELKAVRHATGRYHRLAVAEADGYELTGGCVPGMGYHYIRSVAEGQDDLDITKPNILVYAPQPNGRVKLVAVEYASEGPANLFGQDFAPPTEEVPFYSLHAWVWKQNPAGVFNATNPRVVCDD